MSAETWYVEVTYPGAMRIKGKTRFPWYRKPGYGASLCMEEPCEASTWEETFELKHTESPGYLVSDPRRRADNFVKRAAQNLDEWPDSCQGEPYTIRILQSDGMTEVKRLEGTIGSKSPTSGKKNPVGFGEGVTNRKGTTMNYRGDPAQVLDVLRDVLVEHMDDPNALSDYRIQSAVWIGRSGQLISDDDITSCRDIQRGLRLTMRSGHEYDLALDFAQEGTTEEDVE